MYTNGWDIIWLTYSIINMWANGLTPVSGEASCQMCPCWGGQGCFDLDSCKNEVAEVLYSCSSTHWIGIQPTQWWHFAKVKRLQAQWSVVQHCRPHCRNKFGELHHMQSHRVEWNFTIIYNMFICSSYVHLINIARVFNAINDTHSCLRRPKPVKVPFLNCVTLLSYRFLQVDRGLE